MTSMRLRTPNFVASHFVVSSFSYKRCSWVTEYFGFRLLGLRLHPIYSRTANFFAVSKMIVSTAVFENVQLLTRRSSLLFSAAAVRNIHTTCACQRFFESDKKGEYRDEEWRNKVREEHKKYQKQTWYGVKTGFKELREEIGKWKEEWKERLTDDSQCYVMHGDYEKIFDFNLPETMKSWSAVCDSDHNQGYSRCSFIQSPTGKALFQGYLNTTPPKDGRIKKAGFCAINSKRKIKSFQRDSYYDWSNYTHLVMRVRGDGRMYIVNLSVSGYFDIEWNDIYHYVLYTRGGPYWQNVRIPFSKFVFASKGRVQDMQFAVPLDRIASVGLAVGKIDGPFSLEVDHIGVECDRTWHETFAYEMYQIEKGIVQV